MKKLALIALLIATPAFAQEPSEYTLKVTPQELTVIGKGLGTQPFSEVQPILQKLSTQVNAQNEAVKPKDTPKDEPKKK